MPSLDQLIANELGITPDQLGIATDSIPVVLALVGLIQKIITAKEDQAAQLDALEAAAELVKRRMDQLKFPTESEM